MKSDRVRELEKQLSQQTVDLKSLNETNQTLHKKVAQMRSSIDVGSPGISKGQLARAES